MAFWHAFFGPCCAVFGLEVQCLCRQNKTPHVQCPKRKLFHNRKRGDVNCKVKNSARVLTRLACDGDARLNYGSVKAVRDPTPQKITQSSQDQDKRLTLSDPPHGCAHAHTLRSFLVLDSTSQLPFRAPLAAPLQPPIAALGPVFSPHAERRAPKPELSL